MTTSCFNELMVPPRPFFIDPCQTVQPSWIFITPKWTSINPLIWIWTLISIFWMIIFDLIRKTWKYWHALCFHMKLLSLNENHPKYISMGMSWHPTKHCYFRYKDILSRVPLYYHGLTLIPAWISSHMSSKVCDKISDSFPNLNSGTLKFGYR